MNIPDELREIASAIFDGTTDQYHSERLQALAIDLGVLHVLTIEHKHGQDTTIHVHDESAKHHLHGYVVEWWDDELGEDPPCPTDPEEAITAYFERMTGRESYELTEAAIES